MHSRSAILLGVVACVAPTPSARSGDQGPADHALEGLIHEFVQDDVVWPQEKRDGRFRDACEAGYAPVCDPGQWRPEGTPDLATAADWFAPLCDAGDAHACVVVGWAATQLPEDASSRSYEDGATAFQRACDQGLARACGERGELYRGLDGRAEAKPDLAHELLQAACEAGSGNACSMLGLMWEKAEFGESVPERAQEAYQAGCELGDARGCGELGQGHLQQRWPNPNPAEGLSLLESGCVAGSAHSCNWLGHFLATGNIGGQDSARAAHFYLRSCDLGNASGCNTAGIQYFRGNGVPRDVDRAVALFQRSCDAGHGDGCNRLGMCYGKGASVEQNGRIAAELFLEACELGVAQGCHNAAQAIGIQDGILQDEERASDLYQAAIAILEREGKAEHPDMAYSLLGLGHLKDVAGSPGVAHPMVERALDIRSRSLGPDHPLTAKARNELAVCMLHAGLPETARRLHEENLEIRLRILGPDHLGTGESHNNLGAALKNLGAYELALVHYREALRISGDQLGPEDIFTLRTLNNVGIVQQSLGDYGAALHTHRTVLEARERTLGPDHAEVAGSLLALGGCYARLGDREEALSLMERAVALLEGTFGPDNYRVAGGLGNLAVLHSDPSAALPLMERSLDIRERSLGPSHADTAISLDLLGGIHRVLGNYDTALALKERALDIRVSSLGPSHVSTGRSHYHLALLHHDRGDSAAELDASRRALAIALVAGEPRLLWQSATRFRRMAVERGDRTEAILWGKLAVNEIQAVRAGISHVDAELQDTFLESMDGYYRSLADLLIEDGRLAEAEQVLRMLKEEEYYGFVRRDATAAGGTETASYTPDEQPWVEQLQEFQGSVMEQTVEYQRLQALRRNGTTLTADEEGLLEDLSTQLDASREAFSATLDELRVSLAAAGPVRSRELGEMGLERLRGLQDDLRDMGPGTVLISTVVTEDRVHLLLTTPDVQVAEGTNIAQKELDRAILDLRAALVSPAADPRPSARALYDVLVRPLEPHLEQAGATLLMVSLDANLRYLPLAALHDGERWLVERWPTAVFTPAAAADLRAAGGFEARIGALGVSAGGEVDGHHFPPLPAVPAELDAIVRIGETDTRGVVPGEQYLDDAFTPQQLSDVLATGTSWVHLASHFHFGPGTDADSFLLLGNNQRLTLADLRHGDYPLGDVDQLTLSACETAMGSHGSDGSEVEGLAVLAQNLGARAVLATLWAVSDESTASWMAEMYRLQAQEGLSKAEAVRQTQLAYLSGKAGMEKARDGERGARVLLGDSAESDPALAGWQHPYYWAPYVLMGNWQ